MPFSVLLQYLHNVKLRISHVITLVTTDMWMQVRINLSEQTDMMDLLGADLPSARGEPGQFTW
jgi:midasin (ATPase involved in ribosome maturation)